MSTLGLTSIGTTIGTPPALASVRGAAEGTVPFLVGVSGETPAPINQALVPAGVPGPTTPMDDAAEDAALGDGAISMPARPLAEIIWQLRASVNAGRGSIRATRGQATTRPGAPPRPSSTGVRSPGATTAAANSAAANSAGARAYANVQALGSGRQAAKSVDRYEGKR